MNNRVYKFRAWDDKTKKMWCPSAVTADGRNTALINQFGVETEDRQGDILMQFTGLKDKNGKEIYEGDIVKWNWQGELISEVIFDNGAFHLKNWNYSVFSYPGRTFEVIGNIYENPELLTPAPL